MKNNITKIAKTLRKNSTKAERLLWRNLRAKQIDGLKFRRQEPLGDYVVDFICFEKRLVIEVDGGQHMIKVVKDKERESWLKKKGFKILRFWNNEVLRNIEGILEVISRNCSDHPPFIPPIKGGIKQRPS